MSSYKISWNKNPYSYNYSINIMLTKVSEVNEMGVYVNQNWIFILHAKFLKIIIRKKL